MSHTYAVLEVSWQVYDEIRRKLQDAGYHHALHGLEIDMHGLALAPPAEPRTGTQYVVGVDMAAPDADDCSVVMVYDKEHRTIQRRLLPNGWRP